MRAIRLDMMPARFRMHFDLRKLIAGALLCMTFSAQAQIQFTDITNDSGIVFDGESYGSSWGDVNGDGYPEIFANNHRQRPSLYLNLRNGRFVDIGHTVTRWVGQPVADTHGGTFADFDNDGDQDLMVTTGTANAMQLLVNVGGLLTDRAKDYETERSGWEGNLATWLDFDRDGVLDFIIGVNNGPDGLLRWLGDIWDWRNKPYEFDCFSMRVVQLVDINMDGNAEIACTTFDTPSKIYDITTRPFTRLRNLIPVENQVNDSVWADFNGDARPDLFSLRGKFQLSGATQIGISRIEAVMAGGDQGEAVKTFQFTALPGSQLNIDIDWKRLGQNWNVLHFGADASGPGWVGSRKVSLSLDADDPDMWGMKSPITNARGDMGIYIGYNPALFVWTIAFSNGGIFNTIHFDVTSSTPINNLTLFGFSETDESHQPYLYFNNPPPGNPTGTPTFTEGLATASSSGFNVPIQGIGVVAADFDNDMDLDIYIAQRSGVRNIPNALYENDGSGNFTKVANAAGGAGPVGTHIVDNAGSAGQVSVGDFDVDGFQDLFLTNGVNLVPSEDGGRSILLRNTSGSAGNGNRWVLLDLVGTISNRDAIGASVLATTPDGTVQLREQNGGYHRTAQNHQRLHFGLGPHNTVDLEVRWPSGNVDYYTSVTANTVHTLTEGGASEITTLGGPNPVTVPVDSDGDGAPDNTEAEVGTDPFSVDTDGGGALDGHELALGTDPLNPEDDATIIDSDGDRLKDAEEVELGTDPLLFDTDGGGANDGDEVDYATDPLDPLDDGYAIDSDEDELVDAEEVVLGLDPLNPDTDDDSLNDGDEVLEYFTNPLVRDTDGGGIKDGSEVSFGNDPLNPTDDIQGALIACGTPDYDSAVERGTFLYKQCNGKGNWILEVSGGGTTEGLRFQGTIESIGGLLSYGGRDIEPTDKLFNDNPEKFRYKLWVWNVGVDGLRFEAPAYTCLRRTSQLDLPLFLGEQKFPITSDSLDLTTMQPCGGIPDTDNDGLTDPEEAIIGTDPTVADTDGGGAIDGEEVDFASNPLNPSDDIQNTARVCNKPDFDGALNRATFLWKDCDGSGRWHLRVAGGGTPSQVVYTGKLETPGGTLDYDRFGIEANDVLDDSRAGQLNYKMNVWNAGVDGIDFFVAPFTCFTPQLPDDRPVYLGAGWKLLDTENFDLTTLTACAPPPDTDGDGLSDVEETAFGSDPILFDTDGGGLSDGEEYNLGIDPNDPSDDDPKAYDVCGRPTYDASVDRATFIWKDCDGSNQWHLIATGGGAFPAVVMEGNIQAIGGVTTLKPVNIEPAKDILDVTSDPNTLSYHLEIWNAGWDGFDFTVPKNACFTPTAPEGQPVYLGGNRLLLDAGGINLSNLNSCN